MLHKLLSIAFLILITSCLLVGCKNKENNKENVGGNTEGGSAEVGEGKNDGALADGGSDQKPNDSSNKPGALPDDNGDNNLPDDNSDVTLPDGEDNLAPDNNGSSGSSGSNDNNEQKPEVNEPEVIVPLGTSAGYRFNDQTLLTVDGDYINTADLRGKIIIFNIWATWCPPCRAELPDFNKIAGEYKDDVVIIAAHCYDEYQANVPGYVASNFLATNIVFAYDNASNSGYYAAGGVGYVPQTAIIDRNGIIRYADSGPLSHADLTEWIEKLF